MDGKEKKLEQKEKILIFILSILLIFLIIYFIINQFSDPFFGSHLSLVMNTESQKYLVFEPYEENEIASINSQINSISNKYGLTLLLTEIQLLTGISTPIFAVIPLGIIILFLILFLFIHKLIKDFFLSLICTEIILMDIAFLNLVYNLNTHFWAFLLAILMFYMTYKIIIEDSKKKNIFLLILLGFILSSLYYSLQILMVGFFLSLILLLILNNIRSKNKNNKLLGILLIVISFLIAFLIIDNFIITLIQNIFLKGGGIIEKIITFIANLFSSLNIFDNNYRSSNILALSSGDYFYINFVGLLYYFLLTIIIIIFIKNKFKEYLKNKFNSNEEIIFIFLISMIIIGFFQVMVYLFFNQIVTYLILLLFPIVVFYYLKNLNKKTQLILIIIILTLIVLKICLNLTLEPAYEKGDYLTYDSTVDWVSKEIEPDQNYILTDLYLGEKLLIKDYRYNLKGFYVTENYNNIDFIYFFNPAEFYNLFESQSINYLIITDVNQETRIPIFYGFTAFLKPVTVDNLNKYNLNLIYDGESIIYNKK